MSDFERPSPWTPPVPSETPEPTASERPESAMGHASVTTPKVPQAPQGAHWSYLRDESRTRDEIGVLRAWAERQGFAPGGQFYDAIIDRLAAFDGGPQS